MEHLPICRNGETVGELTMEREGLYLRCRAQCRLPDDRVWGIWAVGEQGELRIGIPDPGRELIRCFSRQKTAPAGTLKRVDLRPAGEAVVWQSLQRPEDWFRSHWLCALLRGLNGVLGYREKDRITLAIPFDPQKSFPLLPLFCLGQAEQIQGKSCILYTFDRDERPVFRNSGYS